MKHRDARQLSQSTTVDSSQPNQPSLNTHRRLQDGMARVQILSELNAHRDLLSSDYWGGSTVWEQALCAICMDALNHIVLAGYLPGDTPHKTQIYLAKISRTTKELVWGKQFVSEDDDEICQVLSTHQQQVLVIGTINSTRPEHSQVMLMKFSPRGNLIYRRCYPMSTPFQAVDAVLTVDGKKCLINCVGRDNTMIGLEVGVKDGAVIRQLSPSAKAQALQPVRPEVTWYTASHSSLTLMPRAPYSANNLVTPTNEFALLQPQVDSDAALAALDWQAWLMWLIALVMNAGEYLFDNVAAWLQTAPAAERPVAATAAAAPVVGASSYSSAQRRLGISAQTPQTAQANTASIAVNKQGNKRRLFEAQKPTRAGVAKTTRAPAAREDSPKPTAAPVA